MNKPAPVLAFAAVVMLVSLACSISGATATPDPSSIDTAVAQTLSAIQLQTAQPAIPTTSVTALPTSTPAPPTSSPTITPSPTPFYTFTPPIPLISVSVDTNCRVGPGKAYDKVGGLMVGEVTEVYGRNYEGTYWYVRNLDVANGSCWLWGEYATVSGDIQALPIFTPPPTPTPAPAFEAEYDGLEVCNGWYLEFKVKNTGPVTLRSYSISVLNKKNNQILSISGNKFTSHDGCTETKSLNVLASGEKIALGSATFNYDPSGDKLVATVRLCTEDDQKGTCITKELEVKP